MKSTLCYCSPAYGAIMHALPRDASALKRMTEKQMIDQATPWVNRVPPQTEVKLHAWAAKAINPEAKGLGDLADLAELEGIGKKLKKAGKKIEKNKLVKKLVKPLAFAGAAFLGPAAASALAKANKARTVARKLRDVRNNVRNQKKAAQTEQADTQIEVEEQAQTQAAPMYEPQYTAQQSFAPVQPQYETQQSFAPTQQEAAPVYQAPQQSFATTRRQEPQTNPFIDRFNNVQRLAPADDQEDRPKIVGISTAGIMQSIKANPIPWTVGGLGVVFLAYKALSKPNQARA